MSCEVMGKIENYSDTQERVWLDCFRCPERKMTYIQEKNLPAPFKEHLCNNYRTEFIARCLGRDEILKNVHRDIER